MTFTINDGAFPQAHEGLLTSFFGEQVKQQYLTFARAVDTYKTRLYSEWEQRVGCLANDKLKQSILCSFGVLSGMDMLNVTTAKGEITQSDGKSQVIPYRYGVNFATELHMIIRESKYLDRMGFQVSVRPNSLIH